MKKELYDLFSEVCPDFAPYSFLKTDLYKGKLIGGYNVYYKKGDNDKEGMVTGRNNIKRFSLDKFPCNFLTYSKFDQSDVEHGWTDEELIRVLNHIKDQISTVKKL